MKQERDKETERDGDGVQNFDQVAVCSWVRWCGTPFGAG